MGSSVLWGPEKHDSASCLISGVNIILSHHHENLQQAEEWVATKRVEFSIKDALSILDVKVWGVGCLEG